MEKDEYTLEEWHKTLCVFCGLDPEEYPTAAGVVSKMSDIKAASMYWSRRIDLEAGMTENAWNYLDYILDRIVKNEHCVYNLMDTILPDKIREKLVLIAEREFKL